MRFLQWISVSTSQHYVEALPLIPPKFCDDSHTNDVMSVPDGVSPFALHTEGTFTVRVYFRIYPVGFALSQTAAFHKFTAAQPSALNIFAALLNPRSLRQMETMHA